MTEYKKPNIEEFLGTCDAELSLYQKILARALIKYRTIHFSGGLGSGRTFVVNLVTKYFEKYYPVEGGITKEI